MGIEAVETNEEEEAADSVPIEMVLSGRPSSRTLEEPMHEPLQLDEGRDHGEARDIGGDIPP